MLSSVQVVMIDGIINCHYRTHLSLSEPYSTETLLRNFGSSGTTTYPPTTDSPHRGSYTASYRNRYNIVTVQLGASQFLGLQAASFLNHSSPLAPPLMQTAGFVWPRTRGDYVCRACRASRSPSTHSTLLARRPFSVEGPSSGEKASRRGARRAKSTAKWYDQLLGTFQRQRPAVESTGAGTVAKELEVRLTRLEKELRGLRGKKEEEVLPTLLSHLPPAQRAKVEEDLRQRDRIASPHLTSRASESAFREESRDGVGQRDQRAYLDRLSLFLKKAETHPSDPHTRKELWRWFSRCKQNIPTFTARLSPVAWKSLWVTQAVEDDSNPDRWNHLKVLGEDMVACGLELQPTQVTTFIEALFLEGKRDEALALWDAKQGGFGGSAEGLARFLEIGVRMFALQGNPARAQNIAHTLLVDRRQGDPRILIPVITAWNTTGGQSGSQRAWALYIRFKELLGPHATSNDYDAVTGTFLRAKNPELAMAVFRDMLLASEPCSNYQSNRLYWRALGVLDSLRAITVEGSETAKVSLKAMSVLPPKFQNKFFWGGWMKKLLGSSEADSAMLVVELMYKRGITPDPKWVNGVIGCWIRMGDPESIEKAEQLAWEMIERQKVTWNRRKSKKMTEEPLRDLLPPSSTSENGQADRPQNLPVPSTRRVPEATLETFNILVELYSSLGKHEEVQYLDRAVESAGIKPDAFFMNHLIYGHFKLDGPRRVWRTYVGWAHKDSAIARPDIQTFGCLWQCAKSITGTTGGIGNREELRKSDSSSKTDWEVGEHAINSHKLSPKTNAYSSYDSYLRRSHHLEVQGSQNNALPNEDHALSRRETGYPLPRALFAEMVEWCTGLSPRELKEAQDEFTSELYVEIIDTFLRHSDFFGALVAMHTFQQRLHAYPDQKCAKNLLLALDRDQVSRLENTPDPERTPRNTVDGLGATPVLAKVILERRNFMASLETVIDPSDDESRKKENLFVISEVVRRIKARGHRDMGWLEDAVQRAAWDMGVGGIDMGDHLSPVP